MVIKQTTEGNQTIISSIVLSVSTFQGQLLMLRKQSHKLSQLMRLELLIAALQAKDKYSLIHSLNSPDFP